jgi:hypothetical protein
MLAAVRTTYHRKVKKLNEGKRKRGQWSTINRRKEQRKLYYGRIQCEAIKDSCIPE